MIQTPKPTRKSDRVHHNNQVNHHDDCLSVLSAGRILILQFIMFSFCFFEKRKLPYFTFRLMGLKFHSFLLS
jgi:hypothetical protein